jgi:hypothetical protein
MDIKELQEHILADEIIRLDSLSKLELLNELIDQTAERLESLSLNELIIYQQNKYEKRKR